MYGRSSPVGCAGLVSLSGYFQCITLTKPLSQSLATSLLLASTTNPPPTLYSTSTVMSGINQPEEELIDYEDDHDVSLTTGANGAAAAPADGEKEKKTYANVHTTGFRYVIFLEFFAVIFLHLILVTSC